MKYDAELMEKTLRLRKKVIETDGRPEWTRTIDLFRVKEAL